MGRPVNKRYFGLIADGTNFTVNAQVGANTETESGYIISQRSETKFLVNDLKTGTKTEVGGTGTGNVSVCTLVDKAAGTLGNDEISLQGTLAGGGGSQVRIKKLYNRTCRDFNNNRYTWEIQDDSTESIMVLTAI
jgi:hypothetical protein